MNKETHKVLAEFASGILGFVSGQNAASTEGTSQASMAGWLLAEAIDRAAFCDVDTGYDQGFAAAMRADSLASREAGRVLAEMQATVSDVQRDLCG